MRSNSDLLDNSVENSYLIDEGLLSKKVKEKLLIDFSQEVKIIKIKNFNFLNYFWNRLVSKPQSFPQKQNTSISSLLEEEKGILASRVIRSVLSEILEFPIDSKNLTNAMQNSNKIFHEDYPGDFILEYQGKRLGMMLLDTCYNSNSEAKQKYRFNPNLKSFQGLF